MKRLISIFVMMSMLITTNFNVNCAPDPIEIVIGYTNDIHGRYEFSESENLEYGNEALYRFS